MEIRDKKLEQLSTIQTSELKKPEHKEIKEKPIDEDTINVKGLAKEIETDNTKKVSELKSKYEAGTLSYDTKDVAKAFLKEAVGLY